MRKQKVPAEMGFTHHDQSRIAHSMKSCNDKRAYRRLQVVWWIVQGIPVKKVAALSGSCLKTIYNYIQLYLSTHQVASLFDAYRSGRPFSAAGITDKRIMTALRCSPLKAGYHTNVWTVASLADYLNKKHQCSIAERTLRRRMKAIGLRFKRPKYVYAQKDPNRTQKKGLLYEN